MTAPTRTRWIIESWDAKISHYGSPQKVVEIIEPHPGIGVASTLGEAFRRAYWKAAIEQARKSTD